MARLLSDGVCNAYLVDVWTMSVYRRQGIASRMICAALAYTSKTYNAAKTASGNTLVAP